MFKFHSIRAKLLVFILPAVLLPLVVIGFLGLRVGENILKNNINERLEGAVQSKNKRLELFLNHTKMRMVDFASDGKIKNCLEDINANNILGCNSEELNQHLIVNKLPALSELKRVFVLNQSGRIVASSNKNDVGLDKKKESYFTEAKNDSYIYYWANDELLLVASAPVFVNGNFIGMVVGIISGDGLYEVVEETMNLGISEGYYLVDKDFYLLNRSQFQAEQFVRHKINTQNAKNCRELKEDPQAHERHKQIESLINHQGVVVLGTHAYLKSIDLCLLGEMHQEEALASVFRLQNIILFFIGLFGLGAFFLSLLIAESLSKPIRKLSRASKDLTGGKLDNPVEVNTEDEVGELANVFNEMVVRLKTSYESLEEQVKNRTKALSEALNRLQKQKEFLEDSKKATLNILEDVEKEKEKTDREKNKVEAIVESIGDGVFVLDKDLNIILFNKVASDISGFSAKEAIGKKYDNVLEFISEKDHNKKNDEFIKQAMGSGKMQKMPMDSLLFRKDGVKVPVADSAAPLKNTYGDIIGCVVVFRDVTKEREIDKAKSEFVSIASHQLRTPLSAVNWYAEMLFAGDAGKLTDRQKDYLEEIYKGNQRMVALVNALLNVSRIDLGTLAIEPKSTDLVEMAQSVLNEFRPKVKSKKLKIKTDFKKGLPNINVDPKLMRIVFQNLISNAVKYTPLKGKIGVSVEKKKSDILITISDTGYGIPKHQQSKIFTKLFRADNIIEKDTEGTGLGLYIVKGVIEEAGGNIWFTSKEGKGTTFYVSLPIKGMKKKKGTKGLSYTI